MQNCMFKVQASNISPPLDFEVHERRKINAVLFIIKKHGMSSMASN
jgi:hypothetical protein